MVIRAGKHVSLYCGVSEKLKTKRGKLKHHYLQFSAFRCRLPEETTRFSGGFRSIYRQVINPQFRMV
jgi:hypothetical protein